MDNITTDLMLAQAEIATLTARAEQAEAALRDAERRAGCEYCKQGEALAYGTDSMQRVGTIYLDGNLLTADLYTESMTVAICCCPICGRPLREDV